MFEKPLPQLDSRGKVGWRARLVRVLCGLVGVCTVMFGIQDIFARFAEVSKAATVQTSMQTLSFSRDPMLPSRLIIPSVGINATVEAVGKNSAGAMATPTLFGDVAWYGLGVEPGMQGSAVFAGHVNNALTRAGIFSHLSDVVLGDTVIVKDAHGHTLTFTVDKIEDYDEQDVPVQEIFSNSGMPRIALITCAGDWDPNAHSFNKRLIVHAVLEGV